MLFVCAILVYDSIFLCLRVRFYTWLLFGPISIGFLPFLFAYYYNFLLGVNFMSLYCLLVVDGTLVPTSFPLGGMYSIIQLLTSFCRGSNFLWNSLQSLVSCNVFTWIRGIYHEERSRNEDIRKCLEVLNTETMKENHLRCQTCKDEVSLNRQGRQKVET